MKRLTVTEKWNDPWFQSLSAKHKLFWLYILDHCDYAGIWTVNFSSASFFVGESIAEKEAVAAVGEHVQDLGNGKWWIKAFIRVQYGTLSKDCRPHHRVFELLKQHGIPLTDVR